MIQSSPYSVQLEIAGGVHRSLIAEQGLCVQTFGRAADSVDGA